MANSVTRRRRCHPPHRAPSPAHRRPRRRRGADFDAETAAEETWADFALTQRVGVNGFPTVIAGSGADNSYALVTRGFQPAKRILPALDHWRAGLADT